MSEPKYNWYIGTCDVCGEAIALNWDPSIGIIDHDFTEDGTVFTWIRHYATAPSNANPDCAKYSSRVYSITLPKKILKLLEAKDAKN